ncbi:MAG: SPASM domain-containing protein [Chitinophagales bacterium]
MPHSACNCRCVMCDIWKGNQQLRQLSEADVSSILGTLRKLNTRQVLMSGGEALLNPNFFLFCKMIREEKISICLLSTGLTVKKNAILLMDWVDELIVSLDGHKELHDEIRNIPGAFRKLSEAVQDLKAMDPEYPISARTVIHRLNFRQWPQIIESAREMGLDKISFLPADVSSRAFNREILWDESRQHEILPDEQDLPDLQEIINGLIRNHDADFKSGFIVESPEKIQRIFYYYSAFYHRNPFPSKKCNAPWVSAVIEADGTVRPCFFHEAFGNIRNESLEKILNQERAIHFRKGLDINENETCKRCVCYLNLPPGRNPSVW